MKRILLIIFTLISLNAFSQLQVKEGSFKYVPGGVIDNKEEYTDGNDLPMALIKISTENIPEQERMRLVFVGNRATQIIKKPRTGSMWVYLSAEVATFIDIRHPDYGTYKYYLPEELCDYCVYEMVLQYVGMQNASEQNYLIVKSDQTNAKIYIDEEYVGNQFTHKQFLVGSTHTWKIECDFYRTESGSITITNEENVIDRTMLPAEKEVTIKTDKDGDKIYIDGNYVGTTPLITNLEYGKHDIKVMRGMQTATKTVEVKSTSVKDEFVLVFGKMVEITSDQSGDKIYVDGHKVGNTPMDIELSFGTHNVKVKRGLKKEIKTINVGESDTDTYYYTPTRETYREYKENGLHYMVLYSCNMVPGLTYGLKGGEEWELGNLITNMELDDIIKWKFIHRMKPGCSISISPYFVMANVSLGIFDFGFGVDYEGGQVISTGYICNLRRVTLKLGFVETEDGFYGSFGIGYNFKHW